MMEHKGYHGTIEVDEERGLLHGEVLGLRDVVTFQGQTVEEARQAFEESVDDYLAFCAQRGEEPEKLFSGKFNVRLGPELHRLLVIRARKAGMSLNAFIRELLERNCSSNDLLSAK